MADSTNTTIRVSNEAEQSTYTIDQYSINENTTNLQANVDLKKTDRRILPLLTALYFLSYLDRINIGIRKDQLWISNSNCMLLCFLYVGNARLFGLNDDLKLSVYEYKWAISIFYISYVSINNDVEICSLNFKSYSLEVDNVILVY